MPDVVLGSICALAGSLLMFVMQEFSKERERKRVLQERRASDLTSAVATLAEALLDYRQLQLTRCRSAIRGSTESADHADRRRNARARAWAAFFRARLSGMTAEMASNVEAVLDAVRDLADNRGPAGTENVDDLMKRLDRDGESIRTGVERLISSARSGSL